ncbi:eukaryotic translation initiation factor 4 gamma 3-like isoform X2 [Silurus meridionalis]|nr:eukaryotic translation initiation factor 4 gamma 3-like isoform X2 [Silurus meridionalis]
MTASSPEEQMLDKPELAFQQSDFDLEPVSTTVENSSVSPVIVEHLVSAETPADEIEAPEAEPPKNELEPSSEDESNDGVLSPVEEPNNNTMHKPEMENKRIQYSRDFLLSIQFMPDCMQKPEGLPSIPDVVLHKCNQNKLPLDPQGLGSRDSNISNIPAGTGSSCFNF